MDPGDTVSYFRSGREHCLSGIRQAEPVGKSLTEQIFAGKALGASWGDDGNPANPKSHMAGELHSREARFAQKD